MTLNAISHHAQWEASTFLVYPTYDSDRRFSLNPILLEDP